MEYKRASDQKLFTKLWNHFKRVWVDVIVLLVMLGLSFLLPSTPEQAKDSGSQIALLALFITKTNSVILPLLLVDIIRKWKWPYLNLQSLVEEDHWVGVMFLLGIYVVIIYAFATGG